MRIIPWLVLVLIDLMIILGQVMHYHRNPRHERQLFQLRAGHQLDACDPELQRRTGKKHYDSVAFPLSSWQSTHLPNSGYQ